MFQEDAERPCEVEFVTSNKLYCEVIVLKWIFYLTDRNRNQEILLSRWIKNMQIIFVHEEKSVVFNPSFKCHAIDNTPENWLDRFERVNRLFENTGQFDSDE